MKHDRSYRVTCLCGNCEGTGVVEEVAADGAVREFTYRDCDDCGGTGEVEVRPLPPGDAHLQAEYAERAWRLVGGEPL